MPSRQNRELLGWFVVAVLIGAIAAILSMCIGCATSEPPPCIPEVRVVPGPPEEITVVGGKLPVVAAPVLESLDSTIWPDERIREDPTGYEEALYSDLIEVEGRRAECGYWVRGHNAAFDEAWDEALARLERIRSEQPEPHDE